MSQRGSAKRNSSLDQHKQRAAGRQGRNGQNGLLREAIRDSSKALSAQGKTGGAFGNSRPPITQS